MSEYNYNNIAHLYDRTRPLPEEIAQQIGDRILAFVRATPETIFFEPGIGTGRIAVPIINRGYQYVGIDRSDNMMRQLVRKFSELPSYTTLIQARLEEIPLKDNLFDVVLTTHVLHLIPDWMKALKEIKRVLKPTGIYLACENLLTPHQRKLENRLREILSHYNPSIQINVEEDLKLAPFGETLKWVLIEQGATVEQKTILKWNVTQTLQELLEIYTMRAFGVCWQVSEEEYTKAMTEFKSWCLETYQSEDFLFSSEATFDIIAAKNWG